MKKISTNNVKSKGHMILDIDFLVACVQSLTTPAVECLKPEQFYPELGVSHLVRYQIF